MNYLSVQVKLFKSRSSSLTWTHGVNIDIDENGTLLLKMWLNVIKVQKPWRIRYQILVRLELRLEKKSILGILLPLIKYLILSIKTYNY